MVAGDEGAAHRDRDEAGGAADVEWLAVGAEYDRDDVCVAGDAAAAPGLMKQPPLIVPSLLPTLS